MTRRILTRRTTTAHATRARSAEQPFFQRKERAALFGMRISTPPRAPSIPHRRGPGGRAALKG
eukprot:1902998-Pyramimonas_sp.AAC.1